MENRDRKLFQTMKDHPVASVVVVIFGLMVLGSIADGGSPPQKTSSSEDRAQVKLVSSDWADGEYGGYAIEGRIRNVSGQTLDYVQVEINLLDGAGNVVGSTLDNVTNLGSGQTWRFSVPVTEEEAMDYKITAIRGR